MATTLYFRSTSSGVLDLWTNGAQYTNLLSAGIGWQAHFLSTGRGASATSRTVNTVAGPTAGLEIEVNSAPKALFLPPPLSADVTISGTVTLNLRASESDMSANAAINCRVMRIAASTGTLTEILKTTRTTE